MWVFQPQSSKNRHICMKRESKFWYRLICQSSINPLLPILIWLIWRTRALVFPYRLICLNILLPAHLTHMPNKSLRPFIPTHLTHERLFSFENKSVEGSRPYPEICTTLHREPCCPLNSLQGVMTDSNPGHFPQQSVALPVIHATSKSVLTWPFSFVWTKVFLPSRSLLRSRSQDYWSELVWRSGSGFSLHVGKKTHNDILFLRSSIDKRQIK